MPARTQSHLLDRFPRPNIRLGKHLVPVYLLTGMLACWTGGLLTLTLGVVTGLPASLACSIVLLSIGGMLLWVWIRRRITGREAFIAIENLLAAMLAVWLLDLVAGTGGRLTDLQVPGLAVFMVFGRIGCFLGGCCYGAPSDIGVCYRHGHHDPDVRRFPAQLVASAGWAVLAIASVGCVIWGPPLSSTSVVLVGYGPLRLANEFLRGDHRPRIGRWTTGALGAVCVWVIGLLLDPTQTLWMPSLATAIVVGAVASSGWWLSIPAARLPLPWEPDVRGAGTVTTEWAGYVLAASRDGEQLYLSVSRGDRLLGPAEADLVLRHHGMTDPKPLTPGVFVGWRRLETPSDEAYLDRRRARHG